MILPRFCLALGSWSVLISGNKGLFSETLKILENCVPLAKQSHSWAWMDYLYKVVMHPALTFNLEILVHIKLLILHFFDSLIWAPPSFYKIFFGFFHIFFVAAFFPIITLAFATVVHSQHHHLQNHPNLS